MEKLAKEEIELECTQFQIHSLWFCLFPWSWCSLTANLNLLIDIIKSTHMSSLNNDRKIKVKLSLWVVQAHRFVRHRGSHTFSRHSAHRWRKDCQPYAPAALYPPGRFLVLISVRGWVDPRPIVRLEELSQLKNVITSSGIKPVTFRMVA
jgi:hypothetical protein